MPTHSGKSTSKNLNTDFQPKVSSKISSVRRRKTMLKQIFGAAAKVIPPKHHLMLVVTRWTSPEFRGRLPFLCGASSITCNCLASTHMKHFAFVGRLNQ